MPTQEMLYSGKAKRGFEFEGMEAKSDFTDA